jgi:hypothetical protein
VPKEFPFRVAYLVPAARFADIYRLFGPAFSVPFTLANGHALWKQSFDYVNGIYNGSTLDIIGPRVISEHLVVVPVRHAPNSARILPLTDTRHEPHENTYPRNGVGKTQWLEFRKELARYVSAQECMLHLGPNTEDTQHICTHCPNALSQMMGHCTPGESVCTRHVVVPVDAVLRLPAGRPRRTRDDKR